MCTCGADSPTAELWVNGPLLHLAGSARPCLHLSSCLPVDLTMVPGCECRGKMSKWMLNLNKVRHVQLLI